MIAAIGPAGSNFDETNSTLQFAQRVSSITTTSKANISEEENLKAALAKEIEELRKELEELEAGGSRKKPRPQGQDSEDDYTDIQGELAAKE